MKTQTKVGTKYWAEFQIQPDGTIKVKKANKLTQINQFKRTWTKTNARNVARMLAQSQLITR